MGALEGDPHPRIAQTARRRVTKRHATEAAPRTADRNLCAESAQVACGLSGRKGAQPWQDLGPPRRERGQPGQRRTADTAQKRQTDPPRAR